jgi:regulator of chromosome condensation
VDEGSLGFSDGLKHQFLPTKPTLELNHKPGDTEKVSSIASGGNHLLVLTTHGNVYSWGAGDQSQLGRRVIARRKIHGTVPEKITLGTRGRKAVIIGAGAYHSFAVDEMGDIWGWGLNSMGQTGTGYKSQEDSIVQLPKKVQRLSKKELDGDVVVQIDGGSHHSIFLLASGKVYACGRFNGGQLGLADDDVSFKDRNDPESEFLAEPALVTFPDPNDPIIQISCGAHNNAAVTRGGGLYCWGQGVQSELGLGDEEEARTPCVVVRKEGGSWFAAAAACGGQHTIGLFRKK